jgi:hypothetical protein
MDPSNQNPQGDNSEVKKLEQDLQNLTQQAAATTQQPMPEEQPVQSFPQVPEVPPAISATPTTPVAPIETNAFVPENPKKSSPLLIIAIILAVVALLAVVAYFFGAKYFAPQLTSTPTPVAVLTPSPTIDPTANWKAYTNTTLGFSFKYPETWIESGPLSKEDTTIIYVTSDEKIGTGSEPLQYYLWVTNVNKLPDSQFSKEIINNATFYKSDSAVPSRFGALAFFITKDEKQYIGIFLTPYDGVISAKFPSQDKYVSIFDQILSTFKFIEATPTVSPSASASAKPTSTPTSSPSATP